MERPLEPLVVATDTEGWPGNPWSLQWTTKPGEGFLIKATDRKGLNHFSKWLQTRRPTLLFHSALHDLAMFRALEIDVSGLLFQDTMVMAYLLQIEPQGLKPGCLRHCNMKMRDYTDVLGDAGNRVAIEYLTWLWDSCNLEREERSQAEYDRLISTPYQDKRGNWKSGRKLKKVKLLPKTKLHSAVERCLSSKRPRGLWEDQIEDIEVAAYNLMGPMPEATLDLVEPREAIDYGCRDTDGTYRYAEELGKRIDAKGLREVYNLELSTYPLIDRMAKVGVKPDLAHFKALSEKLGIHIAGLQEQLENATKRPGFNANSGDQVADYLFGDLKLEEMKLTRSGRGSTNDKILEALEHEHPEHSQISTIREYRETYKLKNTFCLSPETRILTGNLTWREIGSLEKGEILLGFDEDTKREEGRDHHRHWRCSKVVSTRRIKKPCYLFRFDDGTSVVCSTDHQWLARSASSYEKAVWVRSDKLCLEDRPKQTRHGWEIIKPIETWDENSSFDGGYLSGIFDGESCLQKPKYSMRLVFAQKEGKVLNLVRALLVGYGFHYTSDSSRVRHLNIPGGPQVLKFLGMFRPVRLLDRYRKYLKEDKLPRMNMAHTVKIISREYIGEQEVVALETSTHTFIAEGLASHNCDRLPDFVDRWPYDGRIHSTFRTTRVITGRLAASDPNLLAQPEHGKFAKDFKQGWICEPGHVLYQADESQVELRGLAHLSQDPVMLATFRGERRNPDGSLVDLHAALAERIFGVKPKDQDKSKHRLPAKAINFGIPMGMTCKGLSVELRKNGVDADEDTAQRWLDETLGLYKGVRTYMEQRIAEARRNGFIRCLSGRIRYIGGIRSRDERVREEAERFAFSTPIQESAQFVMKQAEKIVWEEVLPEMWKQGFWCEPILQIHDCLKMETEEGSQDILNALMHYAMTQVPKGFSVPLVVESEWGYTMRDMKPFEH